MKRYVIEFRNGAFFRDFEADRGCPLSEARRFDTKEAAEQYMQRYAWILFQGGMVVEISRLRDPSRKRLRGILDEIRSLKEPQVSDEFHAFSKSVSESISNDELSDHRTWATRLAAGITKD